MLKNKKTSWASVVEAAQKEAGAWVAHAEGKDEEATQTLGALAESEESTGDEPEAIPAREMLADLLLETKHPDRALAEYETDLKFNPNRFNGLYGAASAAEQAGEKCKGHGVLRPTGEIVRRIEFRSTGARTGQGSGREKLAQAVWRRVFEPCSAWAS